MKVPNQNSTIEFTAFDVSTSRARAVTLVPDRHGLTLYVQESGRNHEFVFDFHAGNLQLFAVDNFGDVLNPPLVTVELD